MSIYLDKSELAKETIKLATSIDLAARRLWPTIKNLKDINEISLIKIIFDKVDALVALNKEYLDREHLTELDLTNENFALSDSIMDAIERLWPTIKKMRDPIILTDVLEIIKDANRIRIINRSYAQKKVEEEAAEIIETAFNDEV